MRPLKAKRQLRELKKAEQDLDNEIHMATLAAYTYTCCQVGIRRAQGKRITKKYVTDTFLFNFKLCLAFVALNLTFKTLDIFFTENELESKVK